MQVFLLLNDQYLYLLISVSHSIWPNLYEYLAADLYLSDKPEITLKSDFSVRNDHRARVDTLVPYDGPSVELIFYLLPLQFESFISIW